VAEGKPRETLISFESGHYKTIRGFWKGDSVWSHFIKDGDGGVVHVNKDKVEYMETFGMHPEKEAKPIPYPDIEAEIKAIKKNGREKK